MSNQEPDGWCVWHPDDGYGKESYSSENLAWSTLYTITTYEKDEFKRRGFEVRPVCLISPQELSRLRAIEAWAKEARRRLYQYSEGWDELEPRYDAITAPVEAKP